jgi:RNA polymerase sigma factor (sigma-70 family)
VARHGSDPLARPKPLLRQVYAYAAYRVGPGPDAEDVLSDVLERALRGRSTYDPARGEPIAWLIGIARRVIAERRQAVELVEAFPDLADQGDLEAQALDRLALEEALARLPERDQELIALRYGADLTAAAIAEVLEMQVNAVEVALHRALRRLRVLMTEPASGMHGVGSHR